ncbi:thioredoxin [Psychromonas sp. MB-3u-54]|uniref:TlpA disulfide reductase family protein n=1 Tax=Psychromonas sp. MB-3u-54 TaxID=2058319 RepID=UPI000C348867|nr:TlpA disulfide reductase family protein [Psychromonas sp. MB-3u-54]PKH01520.1 thioredoxin [Psychromonas sp. MB-3u-54]
MSRFVQFATVLIILLSSNITVARQQQWLSELDLGEYHNKVVYMDFWASWCGPCRQSFPWLNAMHDKYQDKGLVIIAVNLDQDSNKARQFIKAFPADFLLYSDPKGIKAQKYKITAMPSSYLFSGNGELANKHLGFKKSEVALYEQNIVKLLDQLAGDN